MENPDSQTTAPPAGPGRTHPLREIGLVYVAITLGTLAIDRMTRSPSLSSYTHLAIAALFLATAVQLAQRGPGGLVGHGLELGGLLEADAAENRRHGVLGALLDLSLALGRAVPPALRETLAALLIAAIVFPPFCLGFYLFHGPSHPFTFQPPPDPANYILAQLLVVGLPEEALFRGYFQTRIGHSFPARRKLLWAPVSPTALIAQAALFALLHFAVDLNPVRLLVFFPGLLFGWVRALRGGVGAAVVLHALSNLLSDLLVRGWL